MQTWLIAHAFDNNNSQLVYTAEIRSRENVILPARVIVSEEARLLQLSLH